MSANCFAVSTISGWASDPVMLCWNSRVNRLSAIIAALAVNRMPLAWYSVRLAATSCSNHGCSARCS